MPELDPISPRSGLLSGFWRGLSYLDSLSTYNDFSIFSPTITDTSLFPGRMTLAQEGGIDLPHLMHGASLPQTNTLEVKS